MTDREFFIKTVDDEIPRFDRVFKALPDELDEKVKHHPRNNSAAQIVRTMVTEAPTFPTFLNSGSIDWSKVKKPVGKTVSKLAEVFKQSLEEANEIIKDMTENDWNSKAVMLVGKKVEWQTTKGSMAWGLILDLIHHRGQISMYIRPHGGKVPSIYGPSADTKQ